MPNVPRIEAFHADQAVTICREILAFIQLAARAMSEAELNNAEPDAWHGLAWLAEILSNTLGEVERRDS